MIKRTLRVVYPAHDGQMVLRTAHDWDRDLEPSASGPDATWHDFELQADRSHLEYKPCIRRAGSFHWAVGTNKLLLLARDERRDVYPHFFSGVSGEVTSVLEFPSRILGRSHRVRVYLPAGYHENHLKRYPVLYMHDGNNLFFPEEAFLGQEWQVDETLNRLTSMSLIDQMIVVGIYSTDRLRDYSQAGYGDFGRAVTEELKPRIDADFRTLSGREHTSTLGSSLGGVLAFFMAWEWPGVFGSAACLSSTFWYENDLLERVRSEPLGQRETGRFYLDSGWPRDNYEETLGLATALLQRGFTIGQNLIHFAFPLAQHSEGAWSTRLHLPVQLFSGKLWRAE